MTDAQVYTGAAVMGAAAGMRSMAAPAIMSHFAQSGWVPGGHSPLNFLERPGTAKTMAVLAIGEMIADKLPFMPKRTQAPAVMARAVTGGLSGAAVCSSKKRSVLAGALIGAAAAVGATYAAYNVRKWADKQFQLPDPLVAIIEDAVVAGCGILVISALSSSSNTAT